MAVVHNQPALQKARNLEKFPSFPLGVVWGGTLFDIEGSQERCIIPSKNSINEKKMEIWHNDKELTAKVRKSTTSHKKSAEKIETIFLSSSYP